MDKFKYEGIAPAYSNAPSYNFSSLNKSWYVSIHTEDLLNNFHIIHGEIESDYRYFEFKVLHDLSIVVWGVFRDNLCNGLNTRYENNNIPLPKYLQSFLVEAANNIRKDKTYYEVFI